MSDRETGDDSDTEICPYCEEDYTDPNGVVDDDYRREGHWIMECAEIPEKHWKFLNQPGV